MSSQRRQHRKDYECMWKSPSKLATPTVTACQSSHPSTLPTIMDTSRILVSSNGNAQPVTLYMLILSRCSHNSVSEPRTSAVNVKFVRRVHMYVGPYLWPAQLVTRIMCRYCHHMHLLSCPIPSPSLSKYVQQWDTFEQCRQRGKRWPLRLGMKGPHCTTYHCYLTHARPTFAYTPQLMQQCYRMFPAPLL